VATYRGSDSSAKERFVFHNAGASGQGGSSYIDLVVLRDRDMNTSWYTASDGTLENRIYYCQNVRADVVAITNSSGLPIEFIHYSPYGVPSSYSLADVNHDGALTGDDVTDFYSIMAGSGANIDTNFDGDYATDQDFDDFSAAYSDSSTGGVGVLSRAKTDNRIGYAGYTWDPSIANYHVRHRVYRPQLGRWLSKDPAGYTTGPNLYQAMNNDPVSYVDPTGLTPWGVGDFIWHYYTGDGIMVDLGRDAGLGTAYENEPAVIQQVAQVETWVRALADASGNALMNEMDCDRGFGGKGTAMIWGTGSTYVRRLNFMRTDLEAVDIDIPVDGVFILKARFPFLTNLFTWRTAIGGNTLNYAYTCDLSASCCTAYTTDSGQVTPHKSYVYSCKIYYWIHDRFFQPGNWKNGFPTRSSLGGKPYYIDYSFFHTLFGSGWGAATRGCAD
jgi:RHS repeat-associated protein